MQTLRLSRQHRLAALQQVINVELVLVAAADELLVDVDHITCTCLTLRVSQIVRQVVSISLLLEGVLNYILHIGSYFSESLGDDIPATALSKMVRPGCWGLLI